MAAQAHPSFDIVTPAYPTEPEAVAATGGVVARLAQMHAEAVETARLANLLGRSLHAAIALPAMAVLAIILGGGAGFAPTGAWAILVAVAGLAIGRAYGHAIGQPFERATLHIFAQDLSACLLYAGFAWGAGAFLALPTGISGGAALLYASLPAMAVAWLLRERQAVLLFLAPVAALTSLACVMRPFATGALDAALVLIACAIVAGAIELAARADAKRQLSALPHGLIAS